MAARFSMGIDPLGGHEARPYILIDPACPALIPGSSPVSGEGRIFALRCTVDWQRRRNSTWITPTPHEEKIPNRSANRFTGPIATGSQRLPPRPAPETARLRWSTKNPLCRKFIRLAGLRVGCANVITGSKNGSFSVFSSTTTTLRSALSRQLDRFPPSASSNHRAVHWSQAPGLYGVHRRHGPPQQDHRRWHPTGANSCRGQAHRRSPQWDRPNHCRERSASNGIPQKQGR